MLDVSGASKGVLINRMTTAERDAITNPAQALQIYNTTTKCFEYWENGIWQTMTCATCPLPAQPIAISGSASPCENSSETYSVTNVTGVTYTWTFPSGWTQTAGGTTNSITVTVGSGSGNIQVVSSNVCGSGTARTLAVTPIAMPAFPTAATNSATQTQIAWSWNTVSGAAGYKYNTANNYLSATDNGTNTSYIQTSLTCNTSYTLFVWAYNGCGNSAATTLTQTTASCCVGGSLVSTFGTNGVLTSNPSSETEIYRSIAIDGTGIYVGAEYYNYPSVGLWRIEKRDLTTGALIPSFGTSGAITTTDGKQIYALVLDGTGLYSGGFDEPTGNWQWRIEKRDLNTGALIWFQNSNPSSGNEKVTALAIDGNGLYVAGYDRVGGPNRWRIEKRDLNTGALITSFGTNGVIISISSASINAITLDATGLYLAGYDAVPGDAEWRIEKRDLSTGALITSFGTNGVITSNPSSDDDQINGITIDATGIYAAGYDKFPGDAQWRIEKRNLSTGALITSFGTGGIVTLNPTSSNEDKINAITLDGSGLYMAGQTEELGKPQWKMQKRDLVTGNVIWSQINSTNTTNDAYPYAIALDPNSVYSAGYDQDPGSSNTQFRIEKRCK
jgi:hypothetical protein